MNIGKITLETLPEVEEIGHKFTASVNYPGGFVYEAFAEAWTIALTHGYGEIFCARNEVGKVVGLLGGHFAKDPFNGTPVAAEQFWFVLPEARSSSAAMRLLDAFEAEAKRRDRKKILMVRLEGEFAEILDKVYQRRGYVCVERTYAKDI